MNLNNRLAAPGKHRLPAAPRANPLTRPALAGVVALAISGTGTFGAFTASTSNSGNSISSGTVEVIANDGGTALFNLSGLRPGESSTRCIKITYTGTLQSSIKIHGATSGTGLAPYLDLKVTRGAYSPSEPAYGSCTNFVADAPDYLGKGVGVVYDGTLDDFADNYASGSADPLTAAPESWVQNETHIYKFALTMGDAPPAAQGVNATQSFTWEARNGDGTPYRSAILGMSNRLGYWRLGESSGTTAADSGSTNPGTYQNGVTLGAAGALQAETDTAATFDGVNDRVEIANEAPFDFANGQTISLEAWVKPTALSAGNDEVIVAKGADNGDRQWLLAIQGAAGSVGKLAFRYGPQSSLNSYTTSDVVVQNTYQHVVATYTFKTPASMKVYVNGVLVTGAWGTGQGAQDAIAGDILPAIGAEQASGANEMFTGSIDEVAVYNRALTSNEILAHYNAR